MINNILTEDDLKDYHRAGTCDIYGIDPYDLIKHKVIHDDHDKNIISNFFTGYTGKFLVIGANDGLDQTFSLLENGWKGYYCEPNPISCAKLIENTQKFNDNVTIINSAITPTSKITDFFISIDDSTFSSLDPTWLKNHGMSTQCKIITNTIKFQDLLITIGTDFDLIVIDVEGIDIELCQSINWNQFNKCKMLSLEAGPAVIKQVYQEGNFILTHQTSTNSFYKKIKYLNSFDE